MNQPAPDPLSGRIFTIRGQRVILDADLARMYGATTKVFNQTIKRNAARFPADFCLPVEAWGSGRFEVAICDLKCGNGWR